MRFACALLSLTAIPLCVMSACSRSEDSTREGSPAEPTAAEEPSQSAPLRSGNAGHDYTCGGGLTFNARIDRGNAILTLEGKTLTLAPVEGASGARFAGEGATFIAMGGEAILSREGSAAMTCKTQ